MTMRIGWVGVCLALLWVVPTVTAIPREVAVVATVNGESVYVEDLESQLASLHSGLDDTQRSAYNLDQLMFRVINDTLITQEARALGMHEEEPIPRRLEEKREELARRRLEAEEIWGRVEVSDEEIRRDFAESYRTVSFRILTVSEREAAEQLRSRLDAAETFDTLAEEMAVGSSGRHRSFEKIPHVDVPQDIAAVVFALQPGEIGGPFSTNLGWSIVRAEQFAAADLEKLAEREARIREVLRFREAEALSAELAVAARDSLGVEIDREVANTQVERRADGRLVPKVEDPDAIVATVGGRRITAGAFGRALRTRWRSMRNPEAALASRAIILDRLIEYELLTAEAVRRGYDRTPEADREVNAYLKELLVPRFLDEILAPGIEVAREEMEALYEEHRSSFGRPPRLKLSQVTVEDPELAERVATMLREGADFGWVAREYSVDAFKGVGGDRGWVVPDVSFGNLKEPLLTAKAGAVIGPFPEDDDLFVVLRVDVRREQGQFTFDEMSGNLRESVFRQKFGQRLDEVITQMRESSVIVVHEDVLGGFQLSASVTAQGPHGTPVSGNGESAERNDGR